MTTAYPLAWPQGWPRTQPGARRDSKSSFRKPAGSASSAATRFWTFAEARDALIDELDRLGARYAILSSNYELRLDGLPRPGRIPADTGIAVYFQLNQRAMVMASDRHLRAEENMRSVALAIEAMRQLERHGGGAMMERAFAGFAALPPPSGRPWHEVLGVAPGASLAAIVAAHLRLTVEHHPDRGGSSDRMAEINAARDQARAAIEGRA